MLTKEKLDRRLIRIDGADHTLFKRIEDAGNKVNSGTNEAIDQIVDLLKTLEYDVNREDNIIDARKYNSNQLMRVETFRDSESSSSVPYLYGVRADNVNIHVDFDCIDHDESAAEALMYDIKVYIRPKFDADGWDKNYIKFKSVCSKILETCRSFCTDFTINDRELDTNAVFHIDTYRPFIDLIFKDCLNMCYDNDDNLLVDKTIDVILHT